MRKLLVALAAGFVGLGFYVLSLILTFFLPEPPRELEHE